MRILFLTSEVAPFAKTGGLGDVAEALPHMLRARGHDVFVVAPLYGSIDLHRHALRPVKTLRGLQIQLGEHLYELSVFTGVIPGTSMEVHFLHCPSLYGRRAIYTNDPDEHLRFLALIHGALLAAQRSRFAPDIIHCNDWQTALTPLILRASYAWDRQIFGKSRTVLTIHNLNYQGMFPASVAPELGLGGSLDALHQDDLRAGRINFLLHGILYANAITTVSPTYAREILGPERGVGLDWALNMRRGVVFGILNGVDYGTWNPAKDPFLPARYDPDEMEGKRANKAALLSKLGLPQRANTPLLGAVSRLADQKGFEIAEDALAAALWSGAIQLVVQGQGERSLERMFHALRSRFPRQVWYHPYFDEAMSHQIQGASDFLLVPSRYEPCGLTQMYALKYGTVPIVRRTGGLADTVEQWSPSRQTGTGIVFDAYTKSAVHWALEAAQALYANPQAFGKIRQNGMAMDFSWATQVREYEMLYQLLSQD